MNRAQAQQLNALLHLPPKQWELKIENLLRVNGWSFWRDQDRPSSNKRILKARQGGHPDYEAWKRFESYPPKPLMKACGTFKAGWTPRVFIEAKTGKGKVTKQQDDFLKAADDNPGIAVIVAYPYDYYTLGELLGGVYPL